DLVPLAVAKDEQARRKRVEGERLADQGRQTVNVLAHVGAACGQVHLLHTGGVQHWDSTRTTSASRVRPKPASTSMVARPMRISTPPVSCHPPAPWRVTGIHCGPGASAGCRQRNQ